MTAKKTSATPTDPPADVAPAGTLTNPSGAIIEEAALDRIEPEHPAIDNNPRAGTTEAQNAIDLNDPSDRTPNDKDFAGLGLDPAPYGKGK